MFSFYLLLDPDPSFEHPDPSFEHPGLGVNPKRLGSHNANFNCKFGHKTREHFLMRVTANLLVEYSYIPRSIYIRIL